MSIEERVTQDYAEFQRTLDALESAIGSGDIPGAIGAAKRAATWAWAKSLGIFASPRLESLLAALGHAMPASPPGQAATGGRHRVASVLTQAYETGGHTPLAAQWVRLDRHSEHTLVLSQQGTVAVPPLVQSLADQGLAKLVKVEAATDLARIDALRDVFSTADAVVLHIHPNDPLPAIALAGMEAPPPVLLLDHANHVFWVGAQACNLVVSLHPDGMRIAAGRRGIPRAHMSSLRPAIENTQPDLARAREIRASHGIPDDATLLVSCGAPYKFIPIDGVSLASLVAPVLDAQPEVHLLLVGPGNDPAGTSLAADYPGRVHLAGFIHDYPTLFGAYAAADIYLDVFPFSSGSALHEATALGKPALKYSPQAWSDCGFTINSASLPESMYVAHDVEEYRSTLDELIASPAMRASRGRLLADMVCRYHRIDDYQGQVDELYARAAASPLIELDADIAAQRVELLDTLLEKLSSNRLAEYKAETGKDVPLPVEALSPVERYRRWLGEPCLPAARVAAARARLDPACTFQLLVAATDDAEALARTLDSVARQSLPALAVTVIGGHGGGLPAGVARVPLAGSLVATWNTLAASSGAAWLVPLRAGDVLTNDALLILADALAANPEWACCYADEDSWHVDGPLDPIFKPDINLDLLRSYPYIGAMLAVRRGSLATLGGWQVEAADMAGYDLAFRCIEQLGLGTVGHLAEPIRHAGLPFGAWLAAPDTARLGAQVLDAHLTRLDIAHELAPGVLAGSHRVTYLHDRQPPVSIIIPTRDQLPLLNGLIDSLLATTRYKNYELLIVDNGSSEPASCAYLAGIEKLANPQLRVLRWPHPFNYAAINNFAAAQARGEYLILLNNDTAVLHADWIEALLNHAQRPEVGIVGAKLHFRDGRIQHGGVLLGLHGPADHPFTGEPMDAPGYLHRLQVDQNYSAVTAACLMIRAAVYAEVGGLDEERFGISYNDVDLCLKARAAGYLTVWTPYARLMHQANASQKTVDKDRTTDEITARIKREQQAMYHKWLPLLAHDPAYNRNLSLSGAAFELDQLRTIAWQPFGQPALPRLFCINADSTGCGHYRVLQPFAAMQREGLAEGMIGSTHLPPVLMERFAPTSLVLQRQYTDAQITVLQGYREFSRAFKVYELDDYLPNVPLKSAHHKDMPRDILKSLRKAVALTDRFVVSTAPLAEAFADLHPDIRVVPNRLPVDWWGELRGTRRHGAKPRVGWGGGSSHQGDLEIIADVVRELADEVEWVFFGMCPEKLRPYVHEFHEGVPIDRYPRTLATLDLDLALAPLEDNLFNACKSNLRLLEYGACGFPVICSDNVCYRGDLPVTRVRNRFKEWVDAIRMHLRDMDATAKAGDALREAVHRDWMLTGDNLRAWRDAWLPD